MKRFNSQAGDTYWYLEKCLEKPSWHEDYLRDVELPIGLHRQGFGRYVDSDSNRGFDGSNYEYIKSLKKYVHNREYEITNYKGELYIYNYQDKEITCEINGVSYTLSPKQKMNINI